jgi:hypothetical protein
LKDIHKSFLDSIVVELSLPNSPIPRQILLSILSEAIDETPRDAKEFPQALWDAMGDFAVRESPHSVENTDDSGPANEYRVLCSCRNF